MNLHIMIRKYVGLKGEEIILSLNLVGFLDDEQVFSDLESAPYKKTLRNIIKDGYAQKLFDLGKSEINYLASQYAKANQKNESDVLYVFECLAYGLGWMKFEPTLCNTSTIASRQATTPQPASSAKASIPSSKTTKKTHYISHGGAKWASKHHTAFINVIRTTTAYLIERTGKLLTYILPKVRIWLSRYWQITTEDIKKLSSDEDVKENLSGFCFVLSCILSISSFIAMTIGWYYDIGHAPIWTWLFWESIIIGFASYIYIESR